MRACFSVRTHACLSLCRLLWPACGRLAKPQFLARERSFLHLLSCRETVEVEEEKEFFFFFFLHTFIFKKQKLEKKWTRRTPSTTASPTARSHVSVRHRSEPSTRREQGARSPLRLHHRHSKEKIDVADSIDDDASPNAFLSSSPPSRLLSTSISPPAVAYRIPAHHLSHIRIEKIKTHIKRPTKQGPEVAPLPATTATTTGEENVFLFSPLSASLAVQNPSSSVRSVEKTLSSPC